jgi:cellulase/cellobiase CelA1
VHGTVFVAVAIASVLLIVLARLSIAGSGPFPASISSVAPTANGLAVTVTVTNEGSSAGQTTCRIVDVADRGLSRSAFVLSPRIDPGQTLGFSAVVTEFGPGARDLAVTCRTP